jgi:hypothetical protein
VTASIERGGGDLYSTCLHLATPGSLLSLIELNHSSKEQFQSSVPRAGRRQTEKRCYKRAKEDPRDE